MRLALPPYARDVVDLAALICGYKAAFADDEWTSGHVARLHRGGVPVRVLPLLGDLVTHAVSRWRSPAVRGLLVEAAGGFFDTDVLTVEQVQGWMAVIAAAPDEVEAAALRIRIADGLSVDPEVYPDSWVAPWVAVPGARAGLAFAAGFTTPPSADLPEAELVAMAALRGFAWPADILTRHAAAAAMRAPEPPVDLLLVDEDLWAALPTMPVGQEHRAVITCWLTAAGHVTDLDGLLDTWEDNDRLRYPTTWSSWGSYSRLLAGLWDLSRSKPTLHTMADALAVLSGRARMQALGLPAAGGQR